MPDTPPSAYSSVDPEVAAAADVDTVLFDCDGVLQEVHGGRGRRFRSLLGDEGDDFEDLLNAAIVPTQYDARDFTDLVAGLVKARGWRIDPEEVVRIHLDIERCEETHVVAAQLREAGVRVALATNQHRRRGEHMRSALGYDLLFDEAFYSWEMGVAKPDLGFFEQIVERLAVPAERLLFVDDRLPNVEAARRVGLQVLHWHHTDGVALLRDQLSAYGLPVREAGSAAG